MTKFKMGIRITILGILLEAMGILLDILHHIGIGLETEEGLITGNHLMIFAGFFVNSIGIIIILISSRGR